MDGVNGIAYEKGNADDLAKKIKRLLSDPALCETLGSNAYKEYCDQYHISKFCDNLLDIIMK
jgi:glycosyltransferase involved in cell wall biosynthesis